MNTKPNAKPGNLMSLGTLAFSLQPLARPCAKLLPLALLLALAGHGLAQSPSAINYQGTLTDNVGKSLSNGVYTIQFKIWNSATAADAANYIWGRSFPVHVASNGLFNVVVDDNGGVVGSPKTNYLKDAFADQDRWLGLSIAATPSGNVTVTNEITPRQKLVSAPYALHSTEANKAANADRATYAGTATNATSAANATTFGNMTTNDFLWVRKTSQTLTGNLTMSSNLVVQGIASLTNAAVGTLSVSGSSAFTGAVSANGGISVPAGSWINAANTNLMVIQQFVLPDIPQNPSDRSGSSTNTHFSTADWSAVIAGFQFDGDVEEEGKGSPFLKVRTARNASGTWDVVLNMWHNENSMSGIRVDVLFIRKEAVSDQRP